MFACLAASIVPYMLRYILIYEDGNECLVHFVLAQLLHILWMREAMLVICYDFMHKMIDGDTYLIYPVRNTIQNDVLFSTEYE